MKKVIFIILILLCANVEAGIFRNRRAPVQKYNTSVQKYNNPQQTAEQKASIQANSCRMFHPSGGFGGGTFEGVGCGTTANQALGNCCRPGRAFNIVGQAVIRGRNGLFYACRIYK